MTPSNPSPPSLNNSAASDVKLHAWKLRSVLVFSLLVFALLPAALVGGLMYRSTLSNVDKLSHKIISDVAYRVQLDTESHLLQAHSLLNGLLLPTPTPVQIDQVKRLMANPAEFESLAYPLTQMLPDVSFLYFGDANGAFYGVQDQASDPQNRVKLHIKPADQSVRRYFLAVAPNDRSQELPIETQVYDPRVRPWYVSAVERKARTFTKVYPSASTGQLLITLAQPISDETGRVLGVVGADLFLKALTARLQSQKISENGIAALIDEQGALVATSTQEELFKSAGGELKRLKPSESANDTMRQAYAAMLASANAPLAVGQASAGIQPHFQTEAGEKLIAAVRPFGESQGLKWTLLVAAPDSDFAGETRKSIQQSVYVTLAVLATGALAATFFAYSLSNRFARLTLAAAQLGRGEVPPVLRDVKIAEVRTLSHAMNASALEIQTKRAEIEHQAAALREANENLEQRVAHRTSELEASREEALTAVRVKASFLATMSHEIRTPLNGVVGMTSLLGDTVLNDEQRDYVNTMRVSSDQLLGVINDILDFSKIESGKLELENQPLNLLRTIEEACDMAASRAHEKHLRLLVDVDDNVPEWVLGDVTRIRQLLLNYIHNAIKFTDKGHILVSAHRAATEGNDRAAMLEFRVKDTGIGIPLDRQSALFQSFTQVDASTARRYGGTGLGLAICKRLAELMAGQVGLESVLGEGSTFWFTAQLATTPEPSSLAAAQASMVSLSGKRVLLMDDTPLNLRILKKQVLRWGMQTQEFERAQLGLDWLANNVVDVVVTDMHMPDMDGYEFAQSLRKSQPTLPIILLTSGMAPGGEVAKMFDAVLLKPYRASHLFNALARSGGVDLGQKSSSVAPPTQRKNLRILVADDNAVNRKVALAMLDKLGYDTMVAHNGLEAMSSVVQTLSEPGQFVPFAAVLMDANMPVMDGYTATKQLIAVYGIAAPPIIALTASVLEEDRQRCADAGMVGFLAKPLRIDELADELDRRITAAPFAVASSFMPQTKGQSGQAPERGRDRLVDWSRLEQLKEFNSEALNLTAELIDLFNSDSKVRVAQLQSALDSQDSKALQLAAHALRGSASNVGGIALANLCSDFEQACAAGALPGNSAERIAEIAVSVAATQNALREF